MYATFVGNNIAILEKSNCMDERLLRFVSARHYFIGTLMTL